MNYEPVIFFIDKGFFIHDSGNCVIQCEDGMVSEDLNDDGFDDACIESSVGEGEMGTGTVVGIAVGACAALCAGWCFMKSRMESGSYGPHRDHKDICSIGLKDLKTETGLSVETDLTADTARQSFL